jgi:hypothetical protein
MKLEVELLDELAWALAMFLKRVGYSDYRTLAANEPEAYAMQEAGEKIRAVLAEQGIAPR